MAQIDKRPRKGGGHSYRVRWRYAGKRDGQWQTVTFRDREEAKTFRALVETRGHRLRASDPDVLDRSILTGVKPPQDHDPTGFKVVAERYIATRTTSKATTRETYHRILAKHLAEWHDRPIADITSDDVARMVNRQRDRGLSPVSAYDFAKAVFRYAVNSEPPLRSGNPCASVKVPRSRDRTLTFLTGEEAQTLLDACGDIARPLVDVMLNTGLRFGEVTALRVRDLDLGKQPSLTVAQAVRRPEGGKPTHIGLPKSDSSRRTIALDPGTAKLLRRLTKGKQPDDLALPNPQTGSFWRHSVWCKRYWYPALARAEAAGLTKRPRVHDLRHTHASWLLSDGVPLLVVSRRLGHESVAITAQTYGHVQPEADAAVRAALTKRRASSALTKRANLRSVS